MKKFVALFLALILTLSLVACGKEAAPVAEGDAASTATKGTIAVVTKTLNNPFHVTYAESVKKAGEAAGYTVEIAGPDAETDVDKQISLIETYIEQGVTSLPPLAPPPLSWM